MWPLIEWCHHVLQPDGSDAETMLQQKTVPTGESTVIEAGVVSYNETSYMDSAQYIFISWCFHVTL